MNFYFFVYTFCLKDFVYVNLDLNVTPICFIFHLVGSYFYSCSYGMVSWKTLFFLSFSVMPFLVHL